LEIEAFNNYPIEIEEEKITRLRKYILQNKEETERSDLDLKKLKVRSKLFK